MDSAVNKAHRQEIKQRKFNKRIKLYGLNPEKGNIHSFKSHSVPCSCGICRDEKYRDKRPKHKWKVQHFNYNQ